MNRPTFNQPPRLPLLPLAALVALVCLLGVIASYHIDSYGAPDIHSAHFNAPAPQDDDDMTRQIFNTAAGRKHATLFTLAAGITAGGIIGVSALYEDNASLPRPIAVQKAPAKKAAAPAPQTAPTVQTAAQGQRQPIAADITHVAADQSLHVRAHVWVAQFNNVSVCPVNVTAACRYSADLRDANGESITKPRAGQRVFLHNLQDTGNANAPQPTASAPNIRPRQDTVAGPVAARVIKTGDGDTVQTVADIWPGMTVLIDIRMGEIDTPEKKGRAKCAQEAELAEAATAETRRLLEGKPVLLYNIKYEKYGGRLLADIVTQDGVNAAQNLTTKGYAAPYDGGKKQSWCTIAQRG